MIKQRYQAAALMTAASVLFILLSGKYLLSPLERHMSVNEHAFFLGIGFLATIKISITIAESLYVRFRMMKKRRRHFPKNVEEVKANGVKTPVDFSYMMLQFLFDVQPELLGGHFTNPRMIADPGLSKKGSDLFEEMFGRSPLPQKTIDWSIIAKAEVESQMKMIIPDFSVFSINDYVSPGVQQNIAARWDNHCF